MAYDYYRGMINQYGQLLQQDYQDYLNYSVPVEGDILNIAQGSEKEKTAQRAMELSDQSFDNAALQTNRQLDRYGIRLNSNQREGKARAYGISKVLARVNAANNTRYNESERQSQAKDMAIDLGSELYSSSLDKLKYAADGAMAEIEAKKAQEARRRGETVAGLQTVMSTAMAFSDRKLKKNVKKNDNKSSLKRIRDMKVKNFDYKDEVATNERRGPQTGIMHQEAPDTIKAVNEDGVKGVNLASWLGELTGAVQQLAENQEKQSRQGLKRMRKS